MTTTEKPILNLGASSTQQFSLKPKPAPLQPTDDTPEGWYELWNKTKHPDAGAGLLKAMDSPIRAAARKYAGSDDPVTVAQARSLFVHAIPKYDPTRAGLATFADRHLQPLIRWKARKELPVRVPTLKARQISMLAQAEGELEDELGRSPSVDEIADHVGMPPRQIHQLRRLKFPVLSDQWSTDSQGDEPMQMGDMAAQDDNDQLWLKTVYHSLGPQDQVILESSLGLYGAQKLSNVAIAKKLRISPGRVSQRRTRIQALLDSQVGR